MKLSLYGISKKINKETKIKDITRFWKDIKNQYPEFMSNKRYGFFDESNLEYYCLLEKKFKNSKKMNFQGCDYFAIKTTDFESQNIINTINKGIRECIKSLNYQTIDMPNIEVYDTSDVEILIPIT